MDPKVLRHLSREAERKGTTVNAIVSELVRKYLDFGLFAEKYNFVSIPESVTTKLIDALSEEQIALIASQTARVRPLEYLAWKGQEPTVENLIDYLCAHLLKGCGLGTGEADLREGVWNVTLNFHGEGFVRWAKFFVPALFKELSGVLPKMTVFDRTILFTIADRPNLSPLREMAKASISQVQ